MCLPWLNNQATRTENGMAGFMNGQLTYLPAVLSGRDVPFLKIFSPVVYLATWLLLVALSKC